MRSPTKEVHFDSSHAAYTVDDCITQDALRRVQHAVGVALMDLPWEEATQRTPAVVFTETRVVAGFVGEYERYTVTIATGPEETLYERQWAGLKSLFREVIRDVVKGWESEKAPTAPAIPPTTTQTVAVPQINDRVMVPSFGMNSQLRRAGRVIGHDTYKGRPAVLLQLDDASEWGPIPLEDITVLPR